jgi:23S rRNA pseudouridine1911/1915/1917 synthase
MNIREKILSTWFIPVKMHGVRADQYLKRHIGRISRTRVQKIIKTHDFLLDGKDVKPSFRVKRGQLVTFKRFAPDQASDIDRFKVEKIYEDDKILVLNKPAGLSIHPSANCLFATLTHWLRKQFPQQKINPCHRLDKETSGIVICAKDPKTQSTIKKLFMYGLVSKTYLAIVDGLLKKSQVINIPLGLQKEKGLVAIRMIKDEAGKSALTKIRPLLLDKENHRTLVSCHPKTGRQHQIRAHLSLVGYPIVGDKLYNHGDIFFDQLSRGKKEVLTKLVHPRQALHAARIKFWFSGQNHVFKCSLPEDLQVLFLHTSLLPYCHANARTLI